MAAANLSGLAGLLMTGKVDARMTAPAADPIQAFSGQDRVLRDCIENVIMKALAGAELPSNWRGTLWMANEIMGHVKSATTERT